MTPYKVCVVDDHQRAFFILAQSPLAAAQKIILHSPPPSTVLTVFAVDDFDVTRRADRGQCQRFVLVRMPIKQFVKKSANVRCHDKLADCVEPVNRFLAHSIRDGSYSTKRHGAALMQALESIADEDCVPCFELKAQDGPMIDFKALSYEPFTVKFHSIKK